MCLGVVKRILWFLKQGPKECKLSQRQWSEISDNLCLLSGKLPSEFARQPRSLRELERWKATEFRQFLLYTGPIVLKQVVSKELYNHFMSLNVGVSILLEANDNKRTAYLDYAEELLKYFVDNCSAIYGERFTVYNIHNLKHLSDDARHFRCSLNDVSAFPFENHLQSIKRCVRNAKNPILQVEKRLKEKELFGSDNCESKTNLTYISANKRNGCFLLSNETFAFVREKRKKEMLCDIIRINQTENFFRNPCDSKLVNVVFVGDRCGMSRRLVERSEIDRKVVCLPYFDGFVLLPMLHGMEK